MPESTPVRLLYLLHTLLELVLGTVKLRGTYSGLDLASDCTPGVAGSAAKFAQHHGISLISLAALGALVLIRRQTNTAAGGIASATLATFHASAVAVMLNASHLPVVIIHTPFAIGFALHAVAGTSNKDE